MRPPSSRVSRWKRLGQWSWAVVFALASCGSAAAVPAAPRPRNESRHRGAVDEATLVCARMGAYRGPGVHLDVEDMASEGGHATVFRPSARGVRLRGALLFESQRLTFDYRFRDGELLCAREERSNLGVIEEQRGHPGWAPYWHRQRLVFRAGAALSRVQESAGAGTGRAPSTIRAFAAELLRRADATP